jgi:PAS domain S-box-containing protein
VDSLSNKPWDIESPSPEDMKRLQSLLSIVSDGAPSGFLLLKDGEIYFTNKVFQNYFGLDEADLPGLSFKDFVALAEYERLSKEYGPYFEKAAGRPTFSYKGSRRDGRKITIECLVRSIPGEPGHLLSWHRDITQWTADREALQQSKEKHRKHLDNLKNAQSQIVQREKLASLGTLMAGVTHEITNPINFISGNLAFLRQSLSEISSKLFSEITFPKDETPTWFLDLRDTFADLQESVLDSCEGTDRIKDIVKNLRAFSRVGSQRIEDLDIEKALDGTLRFLAYEYIDRIEVVTQYGRIPTFACKASEMNQVFMNILANAFQSIEGKGVVTLVTEEIDGILFVRISDTGVGIPPEAVESVFEPFFSTRPQGVGLGLSISYEIVRRHGGDLSFSSEPGSGTTFSLGLPLPGLPKNSPEPPSKSG